MDGEVGAVGEVAVANPGGAPRDGYAGQARASLEDRGGDLGDALRDGHALQTCAAREDPAVDFGDAPWDGHAGQAFAALEDGVANHSDTLRDGHLPAGTVVLFLNSVLNDKILLVFHGKNPPVFFKLLWNGLLFCLLVLVYYTL